MMINVPCEIEKIITVANDLACAGVANGSTTETIAAAFVLARMEFLPYGYNMVKAWKSLGDSQEHVIAIRYRYSDLLVPW